MKDSQSSIDFRSLFRQISNSVLC